MEISVIILNYNVKYFLEACIKSVQKALENIKGEIIVVDNASSDGSDDLMRTRFPEITYLYQKENLGFPKGNNIGVKHAKGEFICILNPDTIVAENTFEEILKKYKSLDNPGIIGTRLIDGAGNYLPESKRGTPTPWVALTKAFELYKWFPKWKYFNQYYAMHVHETETHHIDILVGAFMFMKREFYLDLGGFDENCFMYSDDTDLSYLSLLKGKKNYYIGQIKNIHFKGESTRRDKLYMNRFKDAMQFFYKKHFRPSSFFTFFMDIGILLFAMKKKNEGFEKLPKPNFYILISKSESLKHRIEQVKGVPTIRVNTFDEAIKEIQNHKKNIIECLADNDTVTSKDYINFIYKNKKKATFKIKPQAADFFIGSNDKNAKGEILKF